MPTARINGIDLYFEQHGIDGEPLVLVHGYTGDITDWRHQLPEFSRTHRVLIMTIAARPVQRTERSRCLLDTATRG